MIDITATLQSTSEKWTQEQAIKLCRKIEPIAFYNKFHIALTGGLLYKNGERKDCDIIVYSIRYSYKNDEEFQDGKKLFLDSLKEILSFHTIRDHGFVVKSIYEGKTVDIMFPEDDGNYD